MEDYCEYFIRIFDKGNCVETQHHHTTEELYKSMQDLHMNNIKFSVFKAKCVLDFS